MKIWIENTDTRDHINGKRGGERKREGEREREREREQKKKKCVNVVQKKCK